MLPIEQLISEMRADVIERRKAPTYIKWIKAELCEAANTEWEANRIEKAWLETKRELDKVVA